MTHPQSSVTCYILGKAQSLSPELNPPRSPGGKRGLSNPLGLSPREAPAPAQHATPPLCLPGPVLLLPALPGPGFHAVLPPPRHGRHMLTIETRSSDPHEAKVLTVWIQSPEKNAQSPCELGRHRLNLPQQGAFLRHWHGHSHAQASTMAPAGCRTHFLSLPQAPGEQARASQQLAPFFRLQIFAYALPSAQNTFPSLPHMCKFCLSSKARLGVEPRSGIGAPALAPELLVGQQE